MSKKQISVRVPPAIDPAESYSGERAQRLEVLLMELKRVDAIAKLLEDRLTELEDRLDAPPELYALSILASEISTKQQAMLEHVLELLPTDGAK